MKRFQIKDNDWMHIYAQGFEHDDAQIVGTLDALKLLRDAIDEAIVNGSSLCGAMVADGEGFWIEVKTASFEEIDKMPMPYTSYL